jgi:hypothetical protein
MSTTARTNQHPNRESWLADVAGRLRPAFAQLGAPLPDRLRIAIGFPSMGRRAKATGECWDRTASADGTFEILVRPDLAEMAGTIALPVATALARELVRAAVGIGAGKGPAYRKIARGLGLIGTMRVTAPGPAFLALAEPILEAAGPLPHARLHAETKSPEVDSRGQETPAIVKPGKPANRHIKCACLTCGYVVRTARKWIDEVGPPHCPRHGPMQSDAPAPQQ